MSRRAIALCLAAIGLFAVKVSAQPLADRVPEGSIIYIGWQGSDALQPAYAQSKLKQFVDASPWPAAFPKLVDSLIAKGTQGDAAKSGDAKMALNFLQTLVKHPTALFLQGIEIPAKVAGSGPSTDPKPRFGLLCDAGADRDVLYSLMKHIATDNKDPNIAVRAINEGTIVGLVFNFDATDPVLAPAGKGLATSSDFKIANDPSSAVVAYIDFAAGLATIDKAVAQNAPPDANDMWKRGRDTSGLAGIKHLVVTAGFDGADWKSMTTIDAPGPHTGFLKLFDAGPMDPALLKRVPTSAVMASLSQIDLGVWLETIKDVVNKTNPQASDLLSKGMAGINMALSRRLDTELLDPLGTQWLMVDTTTAAQSPGTGIVVTNHPKDAKLAAASWTDASYALSNLLPTALDRMNVTLNFEADDKALPGDTMFVYTVSAFPQTPCWVMHNGMMYIGVDRAAVASAAKAADGENFIDRKEFKDAAAGLTDKPMTGFTWSNLPATGPKTAEIIRKQWTKVQKMASDQQIDLPADPLPDDGSLQKLLAPSASVSWQDEVGFYSNSKAPFPLSGGFNSTDGQTAIVGGTALGASILLPSLNRAREQANRVKSMSNLRQIGMGCMLYGNENKGEAPPDLGTLIAKEELTPSVFVSPSSDNSVPADIAKGTPDQQAAWANEHSDYVYVKPTDKIANLTPQTAVAYEKFGIHGAEGVNILFADGHVEFVHIAQATTLIQAAGGGEPVKYEPSH